MSECNHENKKCIDSRKVGVFTRRRYRCMDCDERYSSLEMPLPEDMAPKSTAFYESMRDLFMDNVSIHDVLIERRRQDEKWGGPENDDKWTALDWHEMISDYNAWARRMAAMGSLDKARRRYIQVAALAVAAAERVDRLVSKK